ncbi:MAG TPA: zinc ribbon domain-containing protein [Pseudonocardiaceae bacterium]
MSDNAVPFTGNVRDLSNAEGWQFEFCCNRCGNGYRSGFKRNKADLGRGLLRSVGSLFGGVAGDVSNAADSFHGYRGGWGESSAAKDKVIVEAGNDVSAHFRQCRGCGDWMCADFCWNNDVGQCLRCSPAAEEEVARAQSAAQRDQIWNAASKVGWTDGVDINTRAVLDCPSCGTKSTGGKFCSACGGQLAVPPPPCTSCGTTGNALGAVFCSQCGTRM